MDDDHGNGRLLARLDERTARIELMQQRFESELGEVRRRLDVQYITRGELKTRLELFEARFEPIRRLVYATVGLVLVAVLGAILKLVVVGA